LVQRFASGVLEHEHRPAPVPSERERPNCPGGIQFRSQRIFVFHSTQVPWSGVLPERCDHKRRLRECVDRGTTPTTVKDELAILAERARLVCKVHCGGLPRRIHVPPGMSVTMTTILPI
jgi:hypothetical protein